MRMSFAIACTAALTASVAPPAAAQGRAAFAAGVVELIGSLDGAYGDEGPRVRAALDAMSRALGAWNRDLDALERQARDAGAAAPGVAVRLRGALILAHLERGRPHDALKATERALQIEPRDAFAHLLRGLVHLTDDPARAAAAFRRAWALGRDDPVKAYWVVQSAQDAGATDDVQAAIDALRAAYRQIAAQAVPGAAPAPFVDTSLFHDEASDLPILPLVAYEDGFALLAAGEYDRAVARLREAADADPLVSDPVLRLAPVRRGIAALREGRPAAAVAILEAALAHAPPSAEAHRVMGLAYRATGRAADGIAQLQAAVRLDRLNERAHLELISLLAAAGQGTDRERALQDALAALPASGSLRWNYAALLRERDREAEMLRQLEGIPTRSILAGRRHVLAAVARLHLAGMRAAAAERPFRLGALTSPNAAAAYLDLGELYRTEGRHDPALASFVAALLVSPSLVDAHTGIGQVHLTSGRLEDAEVAFGRAVALHPEHPDARYGLARTLLRLGRTAESRAHLAAFRRLAEARAAALRRRYELGALRRQALLSEDAGQHDEAAAAWRALVQREPGNVEHARGLGEALVRAGQLERGAEHLERAAALDGEASAYRRLAEVYAALGRADESARAHGEYQRRRTAAVSRRDDAG